MYLSIKINRYYLNPDLESKENRNETTFLFGKFLVLKGLNFAIQIFLSKKIITPWKEEGQPLF